MIRYSDIDAYLNALQADPALAVISSKMAAEALAITPAAVERQIEKGSLEGIRIGKVRCVTASSIFAAKDAHEKKVAKIRRALEQLATKGETTVYAPIMALIGMKTKVPKDRAAIGAMLGEISRDTQASHRFLLSALVFNSNARKPSPSFFGLARDLGYDVDDEQKFLSRHLKRIHKHYLGAASA
jgi:hypothetical protein